MKSRDKLKYLILIFTLSVILYSCKTQNSLVEQNVKSFELGKYSTATTLGGYSLDFTENDKVKYNWRSDITSFDRNGKFEVSNDTVIINYEPLLELKNIPTEDNYTTIKFRNKEGAALNNCKITTFMNGKANEFQSNENGNIILNMRIDKIDSLYFNWSFTEFGIYPKEHKFNPKLDRIDNVIVKGFVQFEIMLEEDLIGHPVGSNEYKLLIVGENELYPGLDYDPNTIYLLGGTLKKASK